MKKLSLFAVFALVLMAVVSVSADYATYYDILGDVHKLLGDPIDALWQKTPDEVMAMTDDLSGYACEADGDLITCYKEHWSGYYHIDFLFEDETLDVIDVYLTADNIAGLFYDENSESVPVANEMMSRFFQNYRFSGKTEFTPNPSKPYIFPKWGSAAISPAIQLEQNSFIQFGFIPKKSVISNSFYLEFVITSGEYAERIGKEDENRPIADLNEIYSEICIREEYSFTDTFHKSCKIINSKGRPSVDPSKGYAQRYITYHKTNPAENRYYEVAIDYMNVVGQPILNNDGYASYRRELSSDGLTDKYTYFDLDGEPIMLPDGYASYVQEKSADGLTTKYTYFDVNGEPVVRKGGYASYVREKSADGMTTMVKYFDLNGEPVVQSYGYASYVQKNSADGLATTYTYFDLNDEPVVQQGGYASYMREKSADGLVTAVHYYGLDGSLVIRDGGYSYTVETYTADKTESFLRYYDLNDQPVVNQITGVAALHYYYDGDGHNKRLDYLDMNDELTTYNDQEYSTVLYRFDEETYKTYSIGYLNTEGNPVAVNK